MVRRIGNSRRVGMAERGCYWNGYQLLDRQVAGSAVYLRLSILAFKRTDSSYCGAFLSPKSQIDVN